VWRDDLGHPVELPGPARRVVSLVPSLTQAVAVSAPGSGRLLTWYGPSLATAALICSAPSAGGEHAVTASSRTRHPVQQAAAAPHELQPRPAGT
jgi:hypothetical protein